MHASVQKSQKNRALGESKMSEKFRKIVNAPHKAVGRVGQVIKRTQPKSWVGKTAKVTGMTTAGVSQFLLWLGKYVTLDNHMLRAMEKSLGNMKVGKNKKGENKKFSDFIKRNPNLSSHIIYYMMLAAVVGGVKLGIELDEAVEEVKIEKKVKRAQAGTYAEFLEKMRPVLPYLVADLVAKEGVKVNDQGMHIPYKDGRGIWTIGFGSTVLKDGTRVKKNTPPITTQQAYELACWHITEKETFFRLFCYDVAFDGVDINTASELLALSASTYNLGTNLIEQPTVNGKKNRGYAERFAELDKLRQEYGNAITAEQVRALFDKYPVEHMTSVGQAWLMGASKEDVADKLGNFLQGGNGLKWRRWLESQVLRGGIKPDVFLKIPVGGLPEFYKIIGDERENWFIEKNGERFVNNVTLQEFNKWLENPVDRRGNKLAGKQWKTAGDWLPLDVVAACRAGKCEVAAQPSLWDVMRQSDKKQQQVKEVQVKTYVIGYEQQYAEALGAFRAKDFAGAAKKYEDMIAQYPDNALLRNDLAVTYNKLGRYDDAIAQVRDIIYRIGDKSQYAAAQYNAGFAYEQKGDYQKALANYKLSLANGNRRVQKDITRVSEKIKQGGNKKIAFNTGVKRAKYEIKQLNQKNARADLLLYGNIYHNNNGNSSC